MKFLSLAQLFGDRKSLSELSRKKASRGAGMKRRKTSFPLYLESLEERMVLSTLPVPVVDTHTALGVIATGGTGGTSAPSTAVDPINPNKVVTVYVDDGLSNSGAQPITVRGSYSNDGGITWTNFNMPGDLTDPTIAPPAPPVPLPQATDATVSWDRSRNFYVSYSEHKTDSSAGYIVLQRFNFGNNNPAQTLTNSIVYAWDGSDTVFHPYVAVDSSLPVDPETNITDPNAGNVYVAWATTDTSPANFTNFNANSVKEACLVEQGATFGPYKYLNTNTFFGGTGTPAVTLPSIAISAGNPSKGIAAGQVTTVFDDFNSGATANPAFDDIDVATMKNPTFGQAFKANGGPVGDAIAGTNGAPDQPVVTTFTMPVNLPAGFNLSQLNIGLDLIHPDLNELEIEVYTPGMNVNGQGLVLLLNNENSDGTTNTGVGVTGANMGITLNGSLIGTYFDSTAPRSIQDTSAAAPFFGHYGPEGTNLQTQNGKSFASLSGTWTLKIIDFKSESAAGSTPPVQRLVDWQVDIAGGFTTGESVVSSTPVRGALNAPYPLLTTASPAYGIGPNPVIAADNTLGSFSVTKGFLYVAFVSRLPLTGTQNQTDNTDIVLYVSSNGGTSWVPGPASVDGLPIVNNDYDDTDGFSEAFANPNFSYIQGRPQFSPQLTVDQSTGTLVASWYDGRYDAARARVARYVGVSIDGGQTFTQTYVNSPGIVENPVTGDSAYGTAYNVITGQTLSLQPIPENFSAGDANTDPTFSYGSQEGLAAIDGNIIATWTGNVNGGAAATTNVQRNEILVAHATFQAGPAVVVKDSSGDPLTTMGPIQPSTAVLLTGGNTDTSVSFNSSETADGTPVFDGFVVYLDRPVDPSTFTMSAVSVFFRDVNTTGLSPGVPVTVTGITPVFDETSALTKAQQNLFGASKFLVSVTPQSTVGTYSYQIAPVIMDRIEHPDPTDGTGATLVTGNFMDQNADGVGGENPTTFTGQETPNDTFAAPSPTDSSQSTFANLGFFTPSYTADTLPIQIPGPHVLSSTSQGGTTTSSGTLVLNATTTFIDVTFDRDMDPTSFTPAQILSFIGPVGAIGPNGAVPASFTITPNPNHNDPDAAHPRTYRISFFNPAGTKPLPMTISGTYSLTLGSGIRDEEGNALDTNQNAGVDALRDTPVSGTTLVTYNSTNVPQPVGSTTSSGIVTDSTIVVPDSYLVQHVTVTLNITYPRDPDLTITLIAPNGIRVTLVSGAGTIGNTANFISTVFDDAASTPITSGGPPFTGRFNPQEPLAALAANSAFSGAGTWTLEIVTSKAGKQGTLNSWSLQLTKPIVSSGLGEAVADQATVSFNIFTMDPTNPQSSNTWTSVGPQSNFNELTGNADSGPIGAIAVDPSDLSGNTVYVAGASGGVWKTTNFLTTDPQGPTYVPLTDFAPGLAMNVGTIAIFGQNHDPLQSDIYAGTGNPLATPEPTTLGAGILRSQDGGRTWTLLDSTTNVDTNGNILPLNSAQRDHVFDGLSINKVLVDPRPTPSGNVIVYAAVTDPAGVIDGVWRSLDNGNHWTKMIAGQATDIVLDPNSGHINVISNPTGNLEIMYAALEGQGVFQSPNEGQVWNQMLGQGGNPEVQNPDANPILPVPVAAPVSTPNTLPQGRIILAKPALTGIFLPDGTYTGNASEDVQYEGWLYAAVTSSTGTLSGLYVTKNFGLSWTKITVPVNAGPFTDSLFISSNNTSLPNADPSATSTIEPARANYDLTLAININDPDIIYVGGLINLRIDITGLYDAGAFYLSNDNNDAGALRVSTTSPISLANWPGFQGQTNPVNTDGQVINLFRDPQDVFNSNTAAFESNIANVANTGGGVTWTEFDAGTGDIRDTATDGLASYLQVVTTLDPLTGQTRLIFGKSNGVFSAVDDNGQVDLGTGTALLPGLSRNGNLSLYQFFYSASQPSAGPDIGSTESAANLANALFYASGFKTGIMESDPNLLTNGNTVWDGIIGSATGVATDQTDTLADGTPGATAYQFLWPYAGSGVNSTVPSPTEFFDTLTDGGSFVSHTFGLIQTSTGGGLVPDAEWPYMTGFNFAVNPIDGDQIVMVSQVGRVFATADRGTNWVIVGNPAALDGTVSQAQAFGSPQSTDPTGAAQRLRLRRHQRR